MKHKISDEFSSFNTKPSTIDAILITKENSIEISEKYNLWFDKDNPMRIGFHGSFYYFQIPCYLLRNTHLNLKLMSPKQFEEKYET